MIGSILGTIPHVHKNEEIDMFKENYSSANEINISFDFPFSLGQSKSSKFGVLPKKVHHTYFLECNWKQQN